MSKIKKHSYRSQIRAKVTHKTHFIHYFVHIRNNYTKFELNRIRTCRKTTTLLPHCPLGCTYIQAVSLLCGPYICRVSVCLLLCYSKKKTMFKPNYNSHFVLSGDTVILNSRPRASKLVGHLSLKLNGGYYRAHAVLKHIS